MGKEAERVRAAKGSVCGHHVAVTGKYQQGVHYSVASSSNLQPISLVLISNQSRWNIFRKCIIHHGRVEDVRTQNLATSASDRNA